MIKKLFACYIALVLMLLLAACSQTGNSSDPVSSESKTPKVKEIESFKPRSAKERFQLKLAESAQSIIDESIIYDPKYVSIKYPGGDVPANTGVCTDVLVRAYRKLGINLQKDVHEDMKRNFNYYPKKWGLKRPDPNIDHRRVPNLQVFFSRKGESLPVTKKAEDYKPGDIVTWVLDNNLAHSGIVSNVFSTSHDGYMIVHNIGQGQVIEDMLFDYKITGHYRYYGTVDLTN